MSMPRGRLGNALLAAVVQGNKAISHLLLDREPDINAHDGLVGSALQTATAEGSEVIARLPRDRGPNIGSLQDRNLGM